MKGSHSYFLLLICNIEKGLPSWADVFQNIKRRNLSVQAKHHLVFVSNQLLHEKNNQYIVIDRAIIVSCIMGNIVITMDEFIVEMIKLRSKQFGTLLPFPSLISLLLFAYNIPIILNINKNIKCIGVNDITHS